MADATKTNANKFVIGAKNLAKAVLCISFVVSFIWANAPSTSMVAGWLWTTLSASLTIGTALSLIERYKFVDPAWQYFDPERAPNGMIWLLFIVSLPQSLICIFLIFT